MADYDATDISPVLQRLEPSRLPTDFTVCQTCPNSVWFSTKDRLKCYCRVMFLVSWDSLNPQPMTECDGLEIGQAKDDPPKE